MPLVDLSHVVTDAMTTYPGLPGPQIGEHLTFDDSHRLYAEGTEFSIGRITMVSNTGTYLDTPGHRHRGGHDLTGLPLERCANLPAVVVDAEPDGGIDADAFDGLDVRGAAVLLRTGWSRHWGSDAYGDPRNPYLSAGGAQRLIDGGATLVGIDSVNIDAIVDGHRPAHTLLLAADVPLVEHLTNLESLPTTGATFTAAPVAVAGMSTFPVRAFAVVP